MEFGDASARGNAVQEIIRMIRLEREEGRLTAGQRLPSERELAVRFRVSRSTVREALRGLEVMGFLSRRKGSGTYVQEEGITDVHVSPQTVLEARLGVEPFLTGLAAIRATARDVATLEEIVHSMEDPSHEAFEHRDGMFHLEIARMARNELLLELAELTHSARANELWGSIKRHVLAQGDRQPTYQTAHHEILEAIRTHDRERAVRAAREHVETVMRDMFA